METRIVPLTGNSLSKNNAAPTVSPSLRDLASTWQGPGEPIPAKAAREIATILPTLRASLAPAGLDALAVAAVRMLDGLRALGVPVPDPKVAVGLYRDALAGLPADLVLAAFKRTVTSHKYGMRPPLPSELLESIRAELDARVSLVAKLEAMSRAKVEDERPMSAAERKAGLSVVEEAMAALRRMG